MAKKLKLKASARDNRRYLLLGERDRENIEKAILDYIGILGFSRASPMFVKRVSSGSVVAIRRESMEEVRACFALAGIGVLRVSGTLKGLGV
jgi:RNase P/RNase MRP subunit POP5